jgi:hypothetical protein
VAWSVPLLEKIGGAHADVALIFSAWALKDPAAAMEFLGTLGPGSSLTSGLDVFLKACLTRLPMPFWPRPAPFRRDRSARR